MPRTPLRQLKPELFEDEHDSDTEIFAAESDTESEDEENNGKIKFPFILSL